jgi:hypothetical protein
MKFESETVFKVVRNTLKNAYIFSNLTMDSVDVFIEKIYFERR